MFEWLRDPPNALLAVAVVANLIVCADGIRRNLWLIRLRRELNAQIARLKTLNDESERELAELRRHVKILKILSVHRPVDNGNRDQRGTFH